jgi:ferritin
MQSRLVQAINEQIQAEFESAYIYLAMSAWCAERNLPGMAHWMRMQWQEETMHATKLYDFLLSRGDSAQLLSIKEPRRTYASAIELFEAVRQHEQYITGRINDLYDLALEERDRPLQIVLQWYISEQVEEEAQVAEIVERLRLVGTDGPSIYLLDRELAQRAAPTAPGA